MSVSNLEDIRTGGDLFKPFRADQMNYPQLWQQHYQAAEYTNTPGQNAQVIACHPAKGSSRKSAQPMTLLQLHVSGVCPERTA